MRIKINRAVSGFLSALIMTVALSSVSPAQIGIGISVRIGPPALPVYVQPLCPGEGYIWTPGYWAWDDDDGYYWVPGTWVLAPVGMLWTPGYWGWNDGLYNWNGGYWGPHIGFYGGINYGFGYTGSGFYGGYWQGDRFFYNRSVTNVNVTNITNVYNKTVIVNNNTRVSYNGGQGGVYARPTPQQAAAAHERHISPIGPQIQHQQAAHGNRQLFASVNHGRPAIAATARPAEFSRGAVPARAAGGAYRPPAISPRQAVVRPGGQNRSADAANNRASSPGRGPAAQRGNSSRPESGRGNPSAAPSAENRSNQNRSNQNRPAENRAPGRSASDNRPVRENYPASSSRPSSPRTENAPSRQNDRPPASSHAQSSPYRESAPPQRENRQPQREAAPPRRESPPPQREAAPPQRENRQPQREVAPPRRESPPPQREVAPPRRESPPPSREGAPRPEHKPPSR